MLHYIYSSRTFCVLCCLFVHAAAHQPPCTERSKTHDVRPDPAAPERAEAARETGESRGGRSANDDKG